MQTKVTNLVCVNRYLFPTYENDPLLTGFEEAIGSEENSGDELLQIPENIVIVPENKKEEPATI